MATPSTLPTANAPAGFTLDTRHDPFHLQVIAERFTYAEIDAHLQELEAFYERYVATHPKAHVALLADARRGPYVDARARRRVAETFARLTPLLNKDRSVLHAIVTNNALMRGALTAILWLFSPPWQIRVFTSMSEADAWLREGLRARGVSAPFPPEGWWRERC